MCVPHTGDRTPETVRAHCGAASLPPPRGSPACGLSLPALAAIRTYYRIHGGLHLTIEDACRKADWPFSICQLTASTGLSLAESLLQTANSADVSGTAPSLVAHATSFVSYPWDGTTLGALLDAVMSESGVAASPLYVWIDAFCASQRLLAQFGVPTSEGARALLRHEDAAASRAACAERPIDRLYGSVLRSVNHVLLYACPLMSTWQVEPHAYLLPSHASGRGNGRPRRGPRALSRSW